jgi:demethylmenaquinone methyltransferase/2-methoxy-6-polyprenyl-1,4-benzoquinol methylase
MTPLPHGRGRDHGEGQRAGEAGVSQHHASKSPESGTPEAEPFTRALERMNRFQEPEAHALVADLELPAGSRGLDVGCGVGLYTLWLAEAVGPSGRVLGIEPGEERVQAARALAGAVLPAPRLEFRVGDGTAVDAPDGAFDWLWCGDVLHHIPDTARALKEFTRVLRPGGRVIVKESQALSALFLPGHPDLERRIQAAEMERGRDEAGERSFQERRQRTLESLGEAGLEACSLQTYLLTRRAPLPAAARDYIEKVVFGRNWGDRLRSFLGDADWRRRTMLCEPDSPGYILGRPDYYCLYPITVFTARTRA